MHFDFSKSYRISQTKEIQEIRKKGHRSSMDPFLIFRLENDRKYPRLAIALTRKCGKSVTRNYFRRRLREFFRSNKALFGARDYLFFSSKPLDGIHRREWMRVKDGLRRQMKLWSKS